MAATANIDTPERAGDVFNFGIAAATKMYVGTLGAINAAGNAVPAADTAGLKVVGRAELPSGQDDLDNSAGDAGDKTVNLKRGVFRLANSATNAVTAAELGRMVYAEDDETVNKTGGTNKVAAGIAVALEGDSDEYVWVDTRGAPFAI